MCNGHIIRKKTAKTKIRKPYHDLAAKIIEKLRHPQSNAKDGSKEARWRRIRYNKDDHEWQATVDRWECISEGDKMQKQANYIKRNGAWIKVKRGTGRYMWRRHTICKVNNRKCVSRQDEYDLMLFAKKKQQEYIDESQQYNPPAPKKKNNVGKPNPNWRNDYFCRTWNENLVSGTYVFTLPQAMPVRAEQNTNEFIQWGLDFLKNSENWSQ